MFHIKKACITAIAIAAGLFAAASNSYAADVYIKYKDIQYNRTTGESSEAVQPARFVQVDVTGPNDFSETLRADANGIVTTTYPDAVSNLQFTVTSEAIVGHQTVAVYKQSSKSTLHEITLAASNDGVNDVVTINNSAVAPAFNICDVLVSGYETLTSTLGATPADDYTINVYWETNLDGTYKNNGTTHNSDGRTVYWRAEGFDYINVPAFGAGYDDDMLLNAYARFLQAEFSRDDAPGDRHYRKSEGDKGYGDSLDLRQAWSEGWAHFFPALVRNDANILYLRPDLECNLDTLVMNPDVTKTGPENEFAVASALWKINDQLGAGNIWTAFTALTGDHDISLEDFWKRIAVEWSGAALAAADLQTIAEACGVPYYNDSDESDDTLANATDLGAPNNEVSSADHTLYGASDVDFFAFTAQQQRIYTIETFDVSAGGDTVISIMQADGLVLYQEPEDNGAATSSFDFTAPLSATYYVKVRRSTGVSLAKVDNDPNDDITSRCDAEFGKYSLKITAKAVDTAGPQIVATGPEANDLTTNTVFVQFDEIVQPESVTTSSVNVSTGGTNITASVTAESTTRYRLALDENLLPNTDYTLTVTSGVTDLFDNACAGTTVQFSTPAIDVTGSDVSVTPTFTIDFGEAMDPATLEGTANISLGGLMGTIAQKNGDPNIYTFVPNAPLAHGTQYTLTILGGVAGNGNPIGVTDAAGNALIASVVHTFTTTDLTVTIDPADAATGVALDSPITVTFNDPVDPATVDADSFTVANAGGNIAGIVAAVADTNNRSYTFTPDAALDVATEYTVTIADTVTDAGGGNPAQAITSTFTTVPLQVESLIVENEPPNDAVPTDGRFIVTFNAPVDPATVTADTFFITRQGIKKAATIAGNPENTVFTLTPDQPMVKGQDYILVVIGDDQYRQNGVITAANGAILPATVIRRLTTEAPTLAVASIDPADQATDVGLDSDITITFNEPVTVSTVNTTNVSVSVAVSPTRTEQVSGTVSLDGADPGNNTVFTFTPAQPLLRDATYTVRVANVTDAVGSSMAGDFQSTFGTGTTGDYIIRGYVRYEDTQYDSGSGAVSHPMNFARYVTLRFYDSNAALLGSATTDYTGYYTFDFGADDPGTVHTNILVEGTFGSQTLRVRNSADQPYTYDVVHDVNGSLVPEELTPASTPEYDIDVTRALTTLTPVFNLQSEIMLSLAKVMNPNNFNIGWKPPFVLTVYWEDGVVSDRALAAGRPVFYNDGGYKIDVPGDAGTLDDDSFDDCLVQEAYARFLQTLYSKDDAPGDRHYSAARADKGYGVRLDLRQAWSEGWAHFASSVMRTDSRAVYITNGSPTVKFNLTQPKVYQPYNAGVSGPDNQFAVASLLWYIYEADAANRKEIWRTFAEMESPATLEEFFAKWTARGNAVTNEIADAAKARGIDYWPDGFASTINTARIAQPLVLDASPTHATFFPAGDVDYFRFQASANQEVLVKTLNLTGGADTVLSITDLDGFVLAREVAGNPPRTWADLDAAVVSSLKFTAPYAGTNDYFIKCEHSSQLLPAIDNAPDDGITSGCPAALGGYQIQIVTSGGGISVAKVDPADAATDVATDVARVLITFDGPVDVDTVTTDTFVVKGPDGTPVSGTVRRADPQSAMHFEYVFDANLTSSAVYTVEVTDGITDQLGTAINSYQSSFTTEGPQVASVAPADAATDVPLDTTVTVTFAADVDPASITTDVIKLLQASTEISGTITQDAANARSFIFTPAARLNTGTAYTVSVTGAADAGGTVMGTTVTSSFTTEALQVASWNPADGATDVPVTLPDTGIIITFNGNIDPSSAFDLNTMLSTTITVATGGNDIGCYVQATGPRTIIVRPAAYLRGETDYTVTVTGGANGVTGANGDELAADATITFTTATRANQQLNEGVPPVTNAKAYAGSGFIDISWKNPFGDWGGLIIAGGTDQFPSLKLSSDPDGNPTLMVENGQEIYQGALDRTSYRIGDVQNGGAPMHISIWVVNGLDHSRAVSLESRAIAGGTGMPGKIDEPPTDNKNNNKQTKPGKVVEIGKDSDNKGSGTPASGGDNDGTAGDGTPVVTDPAAPTDDEPTGPLTDPVVANLPRPLGARAGAGSGFIDVKWQVPDRVDGVIVAVGGAQFPQVKIGTNAQGESVFGVAGGKIIYRGGESKKLRLNTPNGTIRRFSIWTYSGNKVSRAVSLESRAVAGGTGLE